MATANIDGQEVDFEAGETILEAAQKIQVKIPTLCHSKELSVLDLERFDTL